VLTTEEAPHLTQINRLVFTAEPELLAGPRQGQTGRSPGRTVHLSHRPCRENPFGAYGYDRIAMAIFREQLYRSNEGARVTPAEAVDLTNRQFWLGCTLHNVSTPAHTIDCR
jgi:hypothetical protein